jgi:hypothetical protein
MITTRQDVEASPTVLPVTYPLLHNMVKQGDTIYIGRCARILKHVLASVLL